MGPSRPIASLPPTIPVRPTRLILSPSPIPEPLLGTGKGKKRVGKKEHHLWKRRDSAQSGQKALSLVRIVSELPNEKEAVYGALDKWMAWETEFPLIAAAKGLKILRKRGQWVRVIQSSYCITCSARPSHHHSKSWGQGQMLLVPVNFKVDVPKLKMISSTSSRLSSTFRPIARVDVASSSSDTSFTDSDITVPAPLSNPAAFSFLKPSSCQLVVEDISAVDG